MLFGTRIGVKTEETTQIREVRSGASYLCQSDLRTYFGFGMAEKAEIEIEWPSGAKQSFGPVRSNQILLIEEKD